VASRLADFLGQLSGGSITDFAWPARDYRWYLSV